MLFFYVFFFLFFLCYSLSILSLFEPHNIMGEVSHHCCLVTETQYNGQCLILAYTYIISILSKFTWIVSVEKFSILTKLSVLNNLEVVNKLTYYGKWILYKATSSTWLQKKFENRVCPFQFVPHAMSYLIAGLMTILQEIASFKPTWDILVPLF
jgi:hypothetical protein